MSSIFDSTASDKLQPTALAVNLGTNITLSILTLGAFCWLRPRNGVIYARKYKASPEDKRAPKLAEGYFAWMAPVWHCPDSELVEKIGLDAVVFIRFIRMCRQVFIALTILGCGTLIPINVIGTIRSSNGVVPDDKIGLLTVSGIKNLDWLWAHVGAIWAFSTVFGLAILHGYRTFLKFKVQYYESDAYQESMASRTVMLAGLPDSLQDDGKLTTFMSSLGTKDQPVQAVVGRKVNKLPELMAEHKKMVTSLEKIMAKYFADPNKLPEKRPTVRLGHFCGTKVDAIDYYSQQIEELSDKIDRTRTEISKSQPTNYGFVSYPTIQAAHKVAKEFANPVALRTRSKMLDPPELFLSPVPKDIIWFNVSNPKHLRKSRKVIVNVLFFIGSLLFFIPMGFLTTVAKLDRFIGLFPATKPYFDRNPFVAGIVQSLLPILALDILMLLVRKLIVYLAWFQGNITKSSTDRSTLAKFFLFFTLNNLIVFALSGTIMGFFTQIKLFLETLQFNSGTWEAIKAFIHKQDNIVELLSTSVVSTSLFWVNYMSLRNFGVLLDLSQLISLAIYWLKSTVTPRESQAMAKPDVFDFPLFFSVHLFALTVTLLYSVISPLILFFAAVYFSLSSLAYKYQLMYVFRTKVETGGRLFRVVYNRLLAALLLFQIVMIGVLNLKTAHRQSLAIIPLPILTILFKIFLSRHYDPKIDFYDYGTSRTDLRRSNSKSGKTLSSTFENPALTSKMISALVPDGAKKMLSSKVLHGGRDNLEEDTKKANKGRPNYNKQHSSRQGSTSNAKTQEIYEMGHIAKPASTYNSQNKNSYDSTRPLSPQSGGGKQEYGGDEVMDDYYDNQKQSLTKAAANPRYDYNNTSNLYGSQDMTSFVAGRYKANEDPYGFNNSRSNSTASGATGATNKPSYMELAKMHQTDSYKTTGKAMQYEDTNALQALHLPPINFQKPKTPKPQQQQLQQQQQQPQQQQVSDSYDVITVQEHDTNRGTSEEYVEYYVEPVASPKASSRMPRTAPAPRRRDRDNTSNTSTNNTSNNNSSRQTSSSNIKGRNDSYTSQSRNNSSSNRG
ncbi:hypothetical protein BG015_000296 [Linnemannia schmuckeri]|uniref:DUF221-domain-containing protein n=1 Tax=Linnemannia schmuckeri TaxID=64567 RepID=A0A9P5RTS6_9FUNG|nr:hypothetical protein BG015_000296 [Linnemannia schmuckeri]